MTATEKIQNAEQVANNSNIQYTYASCTTPNVKQFDGTEKAPGPFQTPLDKTTEPEQSSDLYLNPTKPDQKNDPYITPTNCNLESQNTTLYIIPNWIIISTVVYIALSLSVATVCIMFGVLITSKTEEIDGLKKKNQELEKRVEDFEGNQDENKVSVLLQRIEELEASLNNVLSQVSSVDGTYDELSTDLTDVNETAQATKESADQLRVELDAEKAKISDLERDLSLQKDDLTIIDGRLTTAEGNINRLKTRVTDLENASNA